MLKISHENSIPYLRQCVSDVGMQKFVQFLLFFSRKKEIKLSINFLLRDASKE
jgi:hypothetical protein